MNPIFALPATCELCGSWLPSHNSSCPRNGKHPSQWESLEEELEKAKDEKVPSLSLLSYQTKPKDDFYKLDSIYQ